MKAAMLAARGRNLGSSVMPKADSGKVASSPRGRAEEMYQCAGITPHSLLLHMHGTCCIPVCTELVLHIERGLLRCV